MDTDPKSFKMHLLRITQLNGFCVIVSILQLQISAENVNGLTIGEIVPHKKETQFTYSSDLQHNKNGNTDKLGILKTGDVTSNQVSMINRYGEMSHKHNNDNSRQSMPQTVNHQLNSKFRFNKQQFRTFINNATFSTVMDSTGISKTSRAKQLSPMLNTIRSNIGSRQQVVNHTATATKRNIQFSDINKRICKLLGTGQNCDDSIGRWTEDISDVPRSRSKENVSDEHFSSKALDIHKRDVYNQTVHSSVNAPSPADVHKHLRLLYRTTLNITVDMSNPNDTYEARYQCLGLLQELFENVTDDENTYCDTSWDRYSCWPRTLAGTNATIPCPSYLRGITDAKNATKFCHENGTWAGKAVYNACIASEEEPLPIDMEEDHLFAVRVIYNTGFTISTLALAIALFIFLYFRSLRCLRNAIHCHLIMTFILKNIVWIIMRHSLSILQDDLYSGVCKMLTSMFNFTHATNFFWMFVEGLYLHIIIVWTYSADKIKLRYLIVVGWVLPALDVVVWIIIRSELDNDHCWLPHTDTEGLSMYDFIFVGPILFVLFLNIIFLSTIVWVLITKLRASHNLETRQYRKAVKATVILFPLLGITYVLFIAPPSDIPKVNLAFKYINAVLQSFQGLLVAIFYCFLNGEVKSVLKKKISRFNEARTLSTRYTKTSVGWTRGGSRDYGNSVTIGNGNLIEMSRKGNSPVDHNQMPDTNETDKMLH